MTGTRHTSRSRRDVFQGCPSFDGCLVRYHGDAGNAAYAFSVVGMACSDALLIQILPTRWQSKRAHVEAANEFGRQACLKRPPDLFAHQIGDVRRGRFTGLRQQGAGHTAFTEPADHVGFPQRQPETGEQLGRDGCINPAGESAPFLQPNEQEQERTAGASRALSLDRQEMAERLFVARLSQMAFERDAARTANRLGRDARQFVTRCGRCRSSSTRIRQMEARFLPSH